MTIIFLPNLAQFSVIVYDYNLVPVKPWPQSEKNKRNEKHVCLADECNLNCCFFLS